MPKEKLTCDVLVIGSGPGGAMTAMLLAEAGMDVILQEEGQHIPLAQVPSYTLEEMDLKYRHSGLTVSMGDPKVSYIEGCCVGGASEINAGLYHRPLPQTMDAWATEFQLKDFSSRSLALFFDANETLLKIQQRQEPMPSASLLMKTAAEKLGWQGGEVPRLWDSLTNTKQSMSQAIVPRFLKAGGRLLTQARVSRLYVSGKKAASAHSRLTDIQFKHVFVCAGAIQTPLLLRRSGLKKNIGNNLRMHPAVRVVAEFDHDINDPREGVPVYQVSEFKPDITLGGSVSTLPHLALWLAGRKDLKEQLAHWRRRAIFYALSIAKTPGKVRAIPFIDQPIVSLPMSKADWDLLHLGLKRLSELLKAANVKNIYQDQKISLSTIHLFCSCPMGENKDVAAVDSFGRMHGIDNLYLNDASILPSTPGVNPQATIMAIARRNVEHFLKYS